MGEGLGCIMALKSPVLFFISFEMDKSHLFTIGRLPTMGEGLGCIMALALPLQFGLLANLSL